MWFTNYDNSETPCNKIQQMTENTKWILS